MWIVSLLIFAVGGVLQAALSLSGANDLSRWITHFGYLIVVGLTANDMRRQALERAGFAFVGLGTGDTPDEALSGFLATADPKLIQS